MICFKVFVPDCFSSDKTWTNQFIETKNKVVEVKGLGGGGGDSDAIITIVLQNLLLRTIYRISVRQAAMCEHMLTSDVAIFVLQWASWRSLGHVIYASSRGTWTWSSVRAVYIGLIGEVTSLIDRFSWFVLCIADKKTKGKSLGLNWEKKAC